MSVSSTILEITNIDIYIKKPKYIFIPIILTMISMLILMLFEETSSWTLYQWISISIILLTFFIVAFGAGVKIKKWIWDERKYNKIMKNPFEIQFIIPPKNKCEIGYHTQTDEPIRVDEITMPPNYKDKIFLRMNPKIDLDIREQQFGLGDKPTDPKILKYNNKFAKKSNVPRTYFIDWWDNYHIVDKISKGKDDVIVHGFEIETHDKGQYTLDIRINISCNRYKNVEKHKTNIACYTSLKVNVI